MGMERGRTNIQREIETEIRKLRQEKWNIEKVIRREERGNL